MFECKQCGHDQARELDAGRGTVLVCCRCGAVEGPFPVLSYPTPVQKDVVPDEVNASFRVRPVSLCG